MSDKEEEKVSLTTKIVAFAIVIGIAWAIGSYLSRPPKVLSLEEQQAERAEQVAALFCPWVGDHRGLREMIKEQMVDPKSYEHARTIYSDRGNYVLIRTTFRARNRFGWISTISVRARIGLDGRVIEVVDLEGNLQEVFEVE